MSTKKCTGCEKELSLDCFSRDKNKPGGLQTICKQCVAEYNKQYRLTHKEELAEKKKQYAEKNKEKIAECGRQHRLEHKQERSERRKQYRLEHGEEARAYERRYYNENNEKVRVTRRRYRATHKEVIAEQKRRYGIKYRTEISERGKLRRLTRKQEISERSRQYYLNNRERIMAKSSRYYAENTQRVRERTKQYRQSPRGMEVHRIGSRKRLERIKNAHGSHTAQEIQEQLNRQKRRCYYCKAKLGNKRSSYHKDHVIPLSRGGSNDISNIVLTCRTCNLRKGNKLLHEWLDAGKLF